MKKVLMVVIAVAVVAAAGVAAADSASVAVTANVIGTCKFNSGGSITYTDLDPESASGTVAGTVTQPQFWCTNNAPYTITDDKGIHDGTGTFRMQHSNVLSDFIPYTFTYNATGSGTGKTAPITMNIASAITVSDLANVSSGSYADTVTLSFTP